MFDDASMRSSARADREARHGGLDLGFRFTASSRRPGRRLFALAGSPLRPRPILSQQEPDRLNRLALLVALASAVTGLTVLISATPS
ncbi:hypothetical protein [Microvirga pudoricolor]|uniref:hypothetical protein n=1 Tax=Microvirga pudoricolor TaxID=2778729 RepID=UPI00194F63B3|nr:hypothetical protein [Microvirga pudoricolor]MBM6594752.1 hypothetical protein [Microvirga pudoricolor]